MGLLNSIGLRRLIVAIVVVLSEAYTSTCCLEQEKLGLLHIKSYFIEQAKGLPDYMSHSMPEDISEELGSWRSDDGNCCTWKRVECRSPFHQHITHISLDGIWWVDFKYPVFTIDVTLFRPFTHLISLDLSNNYVNNMVGHQGNRTLSTLRHIEINGLDLEAVMVFVGSLTTLKKLLFSGNDACTGLSFQEVSRLNQLRVLDCSYCNLRYPQDATLLSQGVDRSLCSYWFLWFDVGAYRSGGPSSQSSLRNEMMDLSSNNVSGEVPRQLFSNCLLLRVLRLSKNHLHGEIIPSYMNFTYLDMFFIDNNHFSGSIKEPLNRSTMISFLDISNNKATGEIPTWMGNLEWLTSLSLAGNQFHGEIPRQLCNLGSLRYLDLSENKFTGTIPYFGSLTTKFLWHLDMHGNRLIGAIPEGFTNLSELVTLDLRNNKLSGGIPWWINRVSNLVILLMGGNRLGGQLPPQLCRLKHVNILDLSNNNISGALPSCLRNLSFGSPENVTSSDFEGSFFLEDGSGRNYSYLLEGLIAVQGMQQIVKLIAKSIYNSYQGKILSVMSELDLSGNKLIGSIPPELGELALLQALNLSHNCLSGTIPTSFSKLQSIESLDLSSNNLSGTIPSELVDLTFLGVFNVSYNNLSGQVPETAQFGTFDGSNYLGNPLLCGSQLPKSCGISKAVPTKSTSTDDKTEDGDEGFDMEVFLWSFGMSSVIALTAFIAVLAINPYWRRAWFAYIDVKFLWWFHT